MVVALRLYLRTDFGHLHSKNPEIIKLAQGIGRTPSALAMKACNFASLDPKLRERNISGLSGTSKADRELWRDFHESSEAFAAEAEDVYTTIVRDAEPPARRDLVAPSGPTDREQLVRVRRVQSFFRAAVLTGYGARCAISGIALPELLVASHIIPWSSSVERRADPRNGLCLNALLDRAFDRGLFTLSDDLRVVTSSRLRDAVATAALPSSLND